MSDNSFIPVYQRLYNYYEQAILSLKYKPGDQLDSINKIMLTHKVSRDTAKQVLSMLAEKGLIVKRVGKGSFVTHGSTTQNVWGVVLPFLSSNMEELIVHLRGEAIKRGYEINCCFHFNNLEKEMSTVGEMIREGYDAVVVVPNFDETKTTEFYNRLISGNTQVVLADYTMSRSKLQYAIQSYELGVKRAGDYLLEKTDKNLLMIRNQNWSGPNLLHELMEACFISFTSESKSQREVHVLDEARELSVEFISKNNIGGILCAADVDAIKVYGRVVSWGICIPQEISLVCYGKTELLDLFKPLITSIDCCYPKMAQSIATIIDEKKEKNSQKQFIFQPRLVVGET